MYTRMHACIYACKRGMFTSMLACLPACLHACMHACMSTQYVQTEVSTSQNHTVYNASSQAQSPALQQPCMAKAAPETCGAAVLDQHSPAVNDHVVKQIPDQEALSPGSSPFVGTGFRQGGPLFEDFILSTCIQLF